MKDAEKIAVGAVAAGLIVLIWYRSNNSPNGSWKRQIAPSAVAGVSLDPSVGMVTPNHLLWWGPTGRPADWTPHKVKYPTTPGYELERLTYGAPGSCVTPAVPRAQRGWLFDPPSEVDY